MGADRGASAAPSGTGGSGFLPATVAVTGGTGFIGSTLIRRLLAAGVAVRALVRPGSLSHSFQAPGLSWIRGGLQDEGSLRLLVEGSDAVVHCAGSVRGRSEADFHPANVAGVERMAQAAGRSPHPRRFLLISSLAARAPELSPYASSKRRGEEALASAGLLLDWGILRPPAVYGPGDRELLPLLKWMRRGLLFVPGGGEGRFSMIFVEDLASAVLSWLACGAGGSGCFELHDGRVGGYSWEEVAGVAEGLYRRRVRRIGVPAGAIRGAASLNAAAAGLFGYQPMLTPGKVRELCHRDWTCDNARLSQATGWRPEVDLREGLLRTLG